MSELPPGWAVSRLGELGRYINGRGFKSSEWSDSGRPIIRIQNLTGTSRHFNYFDGDVEDRYVVKPGNLLIAWAGTLGAYFWHGPEGLLNQHIFRVESYINERFHKYLVDHVLEHLRSRTHGSGMVHITRGPFDETPVLLPPIAEQERIVAAIEEQFSRLDAGVAALERVRQNLKRMRAAVLQAAVTSGDLGEHRRVRLGDVLREQLRNGHSSKADPTGSIPVFTLTSVTLGDFSACNIKLTAADSHRVRDLWVQNGDILIERSNTRELVGTTRLYRGPNNIAVYPDLIIRARVDDNVIPEYAELALQAPDTRRYFQERAQGISGSMPKIDQSAIENVCFSLPPTSVQAKIVCEYQRDIAFIESLDRTVKQEGRRAAALRSSILAAAYSGNLVHQDPSDEPASVLLERITAERTSSNGHKPTRKQRQERLPI